MVFSRCAACSRRVFLCSGESMTASHAGWAVLCQWQGGLSVMQHVMSVMSVMQLRQHGKGRSTLVLAGARHAGHMPSAKAQAAKRRTSMPCGGRYTLQRCGLAIQSNGCCKHHGSARICNRNCVPVKRTCRAVRASGWASQRSKNDEHDVESSCSNQAWTAMRWQGHSCL